MVTTFNYEKVTKSPEEILSYLETFRTPEEILMNMVAKDKNHILQSGVFYLVNQILEEQKNGQNTKHKKIYLEKAIKLLNESDRIKIQVKQSESIENFTRLMQNNAKAVINQPQEHEETVKKQSKKTIEAFNELCHYPREAKVLQKFIKAWSLFTKAFLKEKISQIVRDQ